VLVDDDNPIRRLGDDIGLVQLRPRYAERQCRSRCVLPLFDPRSGA
jgi:hypothetical protein